jgi:hypothetical protein
MATSRGPDNSVRIAINGTQGVNNWANVFHAQLTTSSAIAQADLDTWTAAFAAAYKTRFAPYMSASVAYTLGKAVCFTPGNAELVSSTTMSGNGTEGGTQVSDYSAALCVSWTSSVYWRGGKPRTYLPGVCTNEVLNNFQVQGATVTGLKTSSANFRNDINALTSGTITGTTFGFVSFSSGNAPRGTPLFFPITGSNVHGRLATQRRRNGRWLN